MSKSAIEPPLCNQSNASPGWAPVADRRRFLGLSILSGLFASASFPDASTAARSSARHARRKEAAARGSARLRASLDRRCTRRSVTAQAGTEKRRSNRTEKHEGRRGLISRDASRVQWMATAVDITTTQRHKLLIFRTLLGPSNILG